MNDFSTTDKSKDWDSQWWDSTVHNLSEKEEIIHMLRQINNTLNEIKKLLEEKK